jgi:hypothetical protein
MQIPIDIDIAKLATLNAVQRRVVYDTLDLDPLDHQEAEEAVRATIRKRLGSVEDYRIQQV